MQSTPPVIFTPLLLPPDLTPGTSFVEYQQNQWHVILSNTNALIGKSILAEDKAQSQEQVFHNMNQQLLKLQKEIDSSNIKTIKTQLVNIQQQMERVLQMTEGIEDLLIFLKSSYSH
ncbi:hypothetical protein C9374_013404 [Naegleria lovaniensis]|uniref:Uncharacterized protein n=1 Tax=Naegleria lovaniensis TaxID=51637 RepID=A0AA88GWN9_NAELO|nr:uncharacterized protein C9374_013404 [Naegleria lovaniensis]KAG2391919.1 hypothetical protein C9374_013404 [Naegleria lovaniensis]